MAAKVGGTSEGAVALSKREQVSEARWRVIQYMIAINVTGYGVMLDSWRVTLIGFLMFIVRAVIDS